MNKLLFIIALLGLLVGVAIGYMVTEYYIPTEGNIATPSTLEVTPNALNFGIIDNGTTATRTITLTNIGGQPTQPLALSSSNWTVYATNGSQIAETYLTRTLAWNGTSLVINPQETRVVAFDLYVASSIYEIERFTFTIIITG